MVLYMSTGKKDKLTEVQSPKKTWRLSSVGRAPALQAGGQRFEPVSLHHADLAHLVEQLTCNQ